MDDLEKDAAGNIITRPVLGWTTAPVAGTAVLLALDYAETPAQLRTGGLRLQAVMTVPQARELAAALQRAADRADQMPIGGSA